MGLGLNERNKIRAASGGTRTRTWRVKKRCEKSEKIKRKCRDEHNGLVLLAIRIATDDFFCIVHIRRTTKAYNDTKTTRYCPDFCFAFYLSVAGSRQRARDQRNKKCMLELYVKRLRNLVEWDQVQLQRSGREWATRAVQTSCLILNLFRFSSFSSGFS